MHQGETLRQIMQDLQCTQRALAQQIGSHESYISQQLKKKQLTEAFVEKVCSVLEVSPERLLPEDTVDYKTKYEAIKERYLNEKDELLQRIKELIEENRALREKATH